MGVHSDIMRDTARIVGGESFQGAEVMSTDLRASATLVLMGLVAEGETKVSKLSHLDRGYYQFHEKLVALGADVKRVEEEDDETNLRYVGKQLGIVLLLAVIGIIIFAVGLVIGYGVIGDGKNPLSILSPDTWSDIIGKLTGK